MAMLEVNNLKKIYTTRFGGNNVQALTNVCFTVEQGSMWPSWARAAAARPPC